MKILKHERKGQVVTSEYVLLFFVAVAGISAMSVFVQRAIQARERDGRRYMVDLAAQACVQATTGGIDCMGAAGVDTTVTNTFAQEYEPYYGLSSSKVRSDSADKKTIDAINTWGKDAATATKVDSDSTQKPPIFGFTN